MNSFKIVRFYKKPSQSEINKISNLFSNKPEYYKVNNQIFIFKFKIEDLLDNREQIKHFVIKFYTLVMSNERFNEIISNKENLGISMFSKISFKTYYGDNISVQLDDELKECFFNEQYVIFNELLTNNKLLIDELTFNWSDKYNTTIDQYGNLYSKEINDEIKSLCSYLLTGEINGHN